jgi:hypothetical protein
VNERRWYSSKVRLVVLVESVGATRYADSVYVFRAADFDDAFQRALTLGRSQEKEYVGGEGKRVRWRLKEIISLDVIDGNELDGVEVYAEPTDLAAGEREPYDAVFAPESSKPTQTI